ncbi:hypothetical protein [Gimesia sp.]|uniref:hypothetical protein n=1 Tax=Gimesia sp. TaxID=2024833 RepID=UPI000C576BB3|nr:hypothetical protein [Gimesia sp.]MAX40580.1 hypothetical protein [Gimesia sp.]HAH46492.1 hypothetical protein [Planctomycetaceae bacterium]HBL42062.1 hypothetical protein [Planctomycetaceae bacterium]
MPTDGPRQMSVLLIGHQSPEMEPVFSSVQEICCGVQTIEISGIDEISTVTTSPDLIIVCQNWPDEFAPDVLDDLVYRFPLSRFICCFGAWCESDGRTRMIWPFSIRVPARRATSRIQQEWEIIQSSSEILPLTAGRDEVFLWESTDLSFRLDDQGIALRVSVVSGDRQYCRMLEDQIRVWGGKVVPPSHQPKADVVVYDLDPWESVLGELMIRTDPAPVIGMMGLAHPELIAAAKRWGVRQVVTKLAPEAELLHAIRYIRKFKENLTADC